MKQTAVFYKSDKNNKLFYAVFKKITPCASPTRKIPTDIAPPLSCGTGLGPDTSNSGKKDIKTEEIKKGIMRED